MLCLAIFLGCDVSLLYTNVKTYQIVQLSMCSLVYVNCELMSKCSKVVGYKLNI